MSSILSMRHDFSGVSEIPTPKSASFVTRWQGNCTFKITWESATTEESLRLLGKQPDIFFLSSEPQTYFVDEASWNNGSLTVSGSDMTAVLKQRAAHDRDPKETITANTSNLMPLVNAVADRQIGGDLGSGAGSNITGSPLGLLTKGTWPSSLTAETSEVGYQAADAYSALSSLLWPVDRDFRIRREVLPWYDTMPSQQFRFRLDIISGTTYSDEVFGLPNGGASDIRIGIDRSEQLRRSTTFYEEFTSVKTDFGASWNKAGLPNGWGDRSISSSGDDKGITTQASATAMGRINNTKTLMDSRPKYMLDVELDPNFEQIRKPVFDPGNIISFTHRMTQGRRNYRIMELAMNYDEGKWTWIPTLEEVLDD